MAVQPVPTLTGIPPFPQTGDRASGTYNSKALAFGNHMADTFNDEIEALADNVHHNATEAATAATALSGAAGTATAAAIAASADRVLAQTAAGTATSKAGETSADRVLAQAAATAASNSASQATAAAVGAQAIVLGVSTTLPSLRPSLLLDFANSRYVDPRITVTRSSAATRTNEKRLIETVAAGVPRIDFDPVTLACKSWLIEEPRTNYITNNTMQGAVVGSPGTTPTGWSVAGTGSGLTRSVVAIGEEDGISYIDIRFNGTPTVNNVSIGFAAVNAIAAASGQAWELSVYLRLVGGSFANTAPELDILETDGTNGLAPNRVPCVATGQPLVTQRFVVAATLSNAGTTHVQPRIRVGLTIGQPVDFTLRIGLPQFEAGGFATSVIRTAGAAVTRAADVALMAGANFSSWFNPVEGAFVLEVTTANPLGTLMNVSDGTSANRLILTRSGDAVLARSVIAESINVQLSATPAQPNARVRIAFACAANDFALSVNGAAAVTSNSGALPSGLNVLNIGANVAALSALNGQIARFSYYPKRLTNLELQALSSQ